MMLHGVLNSCLVVGAVVLAASSASNCFAEVAHVSSTWQMSNGDDESCVTVSINSDGFSLRISAVEGQYWLGLASPTSLKVRGYQAGNLAADDHPSIEVAFLDEGGPLRTRLTVQVADYLKKASHLRVSVGGVSAKFVLDHLDAVLRNIADCATSKSLPRNPAIPTGRIKGAENWEFVEGLPNEGCAVRAAGDEIDVMLLLNDKDELILTGGRPDWTIPAATGPINLAIDAAPSRQFEAHTLHNLVIVRVAEKRTLMSLRDGKELIWELPVGKLRSNIRGLSTALDALRNCNVSSATRLD